MRCRLRLRLSSHSGRRLGKDIHGIPSTALGPVGWILRVGFLQAPPASLLLIAMLSGTISSAAGETAEQPIAISQVALPREGGQVRTREQQAHEEVQTISGTVTDPSGAVVPGATVMLMPPASDANTAPESTVHSGPSGEYRLRAAPGTYKLVVLAVGFARFESANIRLGEDTLEKRRLSTLDAQLRLEMQTERVDVPGEFGGEINRGGNAIVLSGRDIETMPLDPAALLDELQGLAGSKDAELFVDGFSGAKLPPRGSIREVRINQNPYSAQNDINPVTGVIEILTKPGTGQMHGQFYLYGVDSGVDAGNPFVRNQPGYYAESSGGDISGPLNRRASYFAAMGPGRPAAQLSDRRADAGRESAAGAAELRGAEPAYDAGPFVQA